MFRFLLPLLTLAYAFAAPATAQEFSVGQNVPTDIISVCRTETAAREILTIAKDHGMEAANHEYATASACGPRYFSFKVLRVLGAAETPDGKTVVKIFLIENEIRGLFFALHWYPALTRSS